MGFVPLAGSNVRLFSEASPVEETLNAFAAPVVDDENCRSYLEPFWTMEAVTPKLAVLTASRMSLRDAPAATVTLTGEPLPTVKDSEPPVPANAAFISVLCTVDSTFWLWASFSTEIAYCPPTALAPAVAVKPESAGTVALYTENLSNDF